MSHLTITRPHAGVHRDEDGAAVVERQLHALEHELLDVVGHGVLNGVDLLGNHGQDPELYPGGRIIIPVKSVNSRLRI